jgi:hypothetical protein
MAKKEIIYQGLADLDVQVDDFSLSSQDYFRIAKLPTEFTAGLNTFRFKGNTTLFAENTPVYIEILDANGDPIYYEIGLDLESAEQAAIITVFINEDTAPGVGYIILCSTANYDVDNTRLDTSQINLRWSTQIYIDPSKRNETEIIFDTLPEISVFPSTGAYSAKRYSKGSKIVQLELSSSNYYYRNDTPIITGYIGNAANLQIADYQISTSSLSQTTVAFPISSLQNATPIATSTITTTQFTNSIDSFIYNPSVLYYGINGYGGDIWDPLTATLTFGTTYYTSGNALSEYLSIGQQVQLYMVDDNSNTDLYTTLITNINDTANSVTFDKTTTNIVDGGFSYIDSGALLPSIGLKLNNPILVNQTNGIQHAYSNASFTSSNNPVFTFEQLPSLSLTSNTQNTNNLVNVYFSNLQPQTGTVAKIKSYYRSAGIGEYILSNETDISDQETEFGFNANVVTASFFLPTVQRNDRLDFKFEFVNPAGLASKQVVESLNNLFLGGNTYIGGDDNLLTGSLYVAGSTGTGVHISGKGSSAMVRSIGYTGFQNAIAPAGKGGFVLYSGSIQPILGSAESYSGVGLELVANSDSYFKYTTSGSGTLDIKTNSFFLGSNSGTFISGSNGNLQISASNFSIINGNVTASNMLLKNISYADFFANKQIVIDSSNATQFYRYIIPSQYAQAYCILDLSGVQGPFATGSAAMYVRFYVNPKLPIAAIISPADSGYDGQIIIETYGPAYTTPTYALTCGTGTDFGENVLFKANYVTQGNLISANNNYFYATASIAVQNFGSPDYYWSGSGQVTSTYFSDTSSITPPIGLSVNTLGKKRSYRSRITFETDDWASYSYNQIAANPAVEHATCPANYESMLSCAPGGRYAFAPGDSGWRLQSVTNYGGSVTPWFANSLTVSKSLQAGTLGNAWTGVTFGTNWTNYGGGHQSVQYKKFGDQVYLRGLATSGANSWNTYPTMSLLPAGYKPPARLIFAQIGNNNAAVRVDIDPNGTIIYVAGGTSPGYISLNGISFSTSS